MKHIVHVKAWHQISNKLIPEPMMIYFTDIIYITRHQCVNFLSKSIWKCLQNGSYFGLASQYQLIGPWEMWMKS